MDINQELRNNNFRNSEKQKGIEMIVNAIVQRIRVVLGLDIGTVKISWVALNAQTGDEIERGIERHNGNPRDIIAKLDKELDKKYIILSVVSTGSMSDLFTKPVIKIPEQAAQEEAAKFLFPNLESYNILRLGGGGFSLLTYNKGKFSYHSNDRCSTGTGVAIERLCQSRVGLSVQEACQKSLWAKNWHKMATRCSVFLKSEITHLANQGYPSDEILLSYFHALASNIWGLVEKRKVPRNLFLVGGVCNNLPLTNRLIELSRDAFGDVKILEEKNFFEAIGVAQIAFSLQRNKTLISLTECLSESKKEITSFTPLSSYINRVAKYDAATADVVAFFGKKVKVIVGLDLGSTGSKIAIVDAETGQVIYTSYADTKGDPVGASQELIRNVPQQLLQKIIGIGLTGSGRNTVASVLQAIFPSLVGRIIVKTEILAHAKGASHFDPDNGESISVIEIGGQDAKYTLVVNGQVVDATMNLACAAGTGSFLGEQASLYEILNIQEFGRLALGAENPANLGQHCTVFIAELANKALQEGYLLPDIFAGFYYSIVYNYINRVMGKRTIGKKIFLQGTPANNIALACAFAAVINRDVIVPPNPGAMGAIGIALLALEKITEAGTDDQYFDLSKFLEAKVVSRSEFQCGDKKCGNGCIINKVAVNVNGNSYSALSGGMCPKYEKTKKVKLPQGAPNPFRERDELLRNILQSTLEIVPNRPTIIIPVGMGMVRFVPFFAHFFHELGLNVRLIWPDKNTMEKGGRLCSSPDMCAPIKVMHGLFDKDADYLFSPKVENLPLVGGEEGSCACPLAQAVPDMVKYATTDSNVVILNPILDFSNGFDSLEIQKALTGVGRELRLDPYLIKLALQKATRVQKQFQRELLKIGETALRYAKDNNFPVVLVCGRLYVITDPVLNSGIPEEIQKSGAIALSIDCYPTGSDTPILDTMYWGEGQRNLRAVLDVLMQDDNNVFPLWLSCYGCGPDSFLEHFFKRFGQGYPHMLLETDGHSGVAGYITRIEAFLDVCFKYLKMTQRETLSPDVSHFQPVKIFRPSTKLIIPSMGRANEFLAAVCRSAGIESVALPPLSQEDFMAGKQDCSGKECLPFILLWGSIKNCLLRNGGDQTFFVSTTDGPCRFCMYHIRIKQLLEDLLGKNDAKKVSLLSPSTSNTYSLGLNQTTQLKMWSAVVAFDLLRDMLLYFRPISTDPTSVEGIYNHYKEEFIRLLEQPSSIWTTWGLTELMQEAANIFSAVPVDPVKARDIIDVGIVGEIYVRGVEFANDNLIRKIESLDMRVRLAPNREWINYVGFCERGKSGWWKVHKEKWSRRLFERRLYNICAEILGWPHDHSVEDIVNAGMPFLGPIPQGEAILGIGSLILMHELGLIKGGVLIGPYGCMPTKIAESQLTKTKVPLITIYCDGEPIDINRLAAFAWQLGGKKSLRF